MEIWMLLVWCNHWCTTIVIVQQSHCCLHQAVMARPRACQKHWAHKFDVIIPRQWTWRLVCGPCLCTTAPPSSRSVSRPHLGADCACVCSCQFLLVLMCICAYWRVNWIKKKSAVRACVFVCVREGIQDYTCGAQMLQHAAALSVLLLVGKSHSFASYYILMCRVHGFILTHRSNWNCTLFGCLRWKELRLTHLFEMWLCTWKQAA